jgi:hypothetical protein
MTGKSCLSTFFSLQKMEAFLDFCEDQISCIAVSCLQFHDTQNHAL